MVLSTQMFNEQLEQLEKQINRYQSLLSSGFNKLRFSADIEKDYSWRSNVNFTKASRGILSVGILFYLSFGLMDHALGQEHKDTLWFIRILVAGILLTGLAILFNRQLIRWIVLAVTLGMIIIGLSILVFINLLNEPYSYAYHLGFIPWQVFILISLRSYLRPIIVSSLTIFISYIIFSYNQDLQPYSPEVDALVDDVRPIFILFWGLLIAMGVYLGYFMERSCRIDYVKNRLLALDAQRLTLLSEELHLLSTTDSLTGMANRRHFENCYDSEWRRAVRAQDSLAIIMIDVDFFKNYNDEYGHQEGDKCLKQVSSALMTYAQRSGEMIARYGGEEFIVLLPRMSLAGAQHIAESMCRKISQLGIEHKASEEGMVTISIGIAAMIPTVQDVPDILLKDSDRMLYQAKANGRNCVAS
ncbi:MAG: GGDEF domain-containing protein [Oleispira sp.]|nr:GGDEF domain-containing protein [Oleispira sp.]